MPSPDLPPAISFDVNGTSRTMSLPPRQGAGPVRSVMLLGLPKAGSTLLARLMRPVTASAGLTPFSLHTAFWQLGLHEDDWPEAVDPLFVPEGYAYLGFRGWPRRHRFPAWAGGRTVLLVRDPRDMLVSQYFSAAYSHVPPGREAGDAFARAFEERRRRLQDTPIDDFVLSAAPRLTRIHADMTAALEGTDHRVWRYEDVIFDKLRWTRDMVAWLDLGPAPGVIEAAVAQNDLRPAEEAASEHVRRVTPGDHRDKLRPGTVARLDDLLRDMLAAYDYA